MSITLDSPELATTSTDLDECKHIVSDETPGNCDVTEAMMLGKELTALCGYKFIPHRDDEALPACKACLDVMEMLYGAAD